MILRYISSKRGMSKLASLKTPMYNRLLGVLPRLLSASDHTITNDRIITSASRRVTEHPVLTIPNREQVTFTWNGTDMTGYKGEALSSALIANGIDIFGHHHKDHSPQGIFCANGQCSQCMVIVNGLPMKSCMVPTVSGLNVKPLDGKAVLPADDALVSVRPPEAPTDVDVLVVGAGPAGLSAATELGKLGIHVMLIDDKDRVGGKLVLQTHKFFGTKEDCYAGTRGFKIADILYDKVKVHPSVDIRLNTTALAVYSDKLVALVTGDKHTLVRPKKLLVAAGAREKFLTFPGNTLPGVFGAGAFQTLVNRDLVRPCKKVLIVGGGNVGLIAGYHALQAGIEVAGLVEALPECGGYQVHLDKLHRMGVPIMTNTTVVEARGKDRVEEVVVANVDKNFQPIPGTLKSYQVDCLLIAVGLESCNEFHRKAVHYGLDSFLAGDANEIAEASSAMMTGKIAGIKIAKSLGYNVADIPKEWHEKEKVLKSKPGPIDNKRVAAETPTVGCAPVIHCYQEVPCNACTTACDLKNIKIGGDGIYGIPKYEGDIHSCTGCVRCVTRCPGLAITLVDYDVDPHFPRVTIPYELWRGVVAPGESVTIVQDDGTPLGRYEVEAVQVDKEVGTSAVSVRIERELARRAAGVWYVATEANLRHEANENVLADDAIICRCERVTVGEIRRLLRSDIRDENELKAASRCGMGACGSKTCHASLQRLYREEGIERSSVRERTLRPLFVETPLGVFADIIQ